MKISVLLRLLLPMMLIFAGPAWAQMSIRVESHTNQRHITIGLFPIQRIPEKMASLVLAKDPQEEWQKEQFKAMIEVENELKTNKNARFVPPRAMPEPSGPDFSKAIWTSFKTNMSVDLGEGDGKRTIWLGYKYQGEPNPEWEGIEVTLQTTPPTIVILSPQPGVVSQPVIQLQGSNTMELKSVRYDVIGPNGNMTVRNQLGNSHGTRLDTDLQEYVADFFTCYDVSLEAGTNTIVLRCTDEAGNVVTTNLTYVFSTTEVTKGPGLTVDWPVNNDCISGSNFAVHGNSDDDTAKIVALIVNPGGEASKREALVERNGRYWVENIPLQEGRTYITLIANNAAGYSTVTNISNRKNHYQLTMDPVPDSQLWQQTVTATGTGSLIYTNYVITVNGTKAIMDSSGRWKAENVPMTEGGVAIFNISAISKNGRYESNEPDPYPTVPITWGVETNGIKWGIYLAPGDTNHMNRQHCDFYVVNDTGTNMNFLWMRPKEESIYSLNLHDQAGTDVARSYLGKEKGQPLAANLDMRHLDVEAIGQIDGVLPLFTNVPVHVCSVDLLDQFSVGSAGEYRAQVVGRLYQIANDGKLNPLELPPVSMPVTIEDQPSELVFHLRDLQTKGNFVWGDPTNFLSVGIAHSLEPQRVGKGDEIEVFLMNSSTNDLHNLLLPAPDQQFAISLFDSLGNEVTKTALGAQQGIPLLMDAHAQGVNPVFIAARDAAKCERFNLDAYFEIKTAGKYRFTYQQRLYQIDTNGIPEGVTLPMVTVPIDIQ